MAEPKKPAKAKDEKPKAEKEEKKPATQEAAPEAAKPQAAAEEAKPKKEAPVKGKKEDKPAPASENLSLDPDSVEAPKIVKAKGAKNIHSGIAHVYATFNNTICTITDLTGNVIGWS